MASLGGPRWTRRRRPSRSRCRGSHPNISPHLHTSLPKSPEISPYLPISLPTSQTLPNSPKLSACRPPTRREPSSALLTKARSHEGAGTPPHAAGDGRARRLLRLRRLRGAAQARFRDGPRSPEMTRDDTRLGAAQVCVRPRDRIPRDDPRLGTCLPSC